MDFSKICDRDLYELFDLPFKSTPAEIRKAYRKKALECHPDKNPDNPKAGELFNELTEALAVLLDESARAAYDRLLEAKKTAKLRHKELDDRRKKFKVDLESRENEYFLNKSKRINEEHKLRNEIARLRKEGAKLLEEEIKLVQEEISSSVNKSNAASGADFKIKIEWVCSQDGEAGVYTKEVLERIFHKYGDVSALVFSEKKGKGKGIVEFKEKSAAELAMKLELGLINNPLKLKWINDGKTKNYESKPSGETLITERDYESLVLRKMRQAEERKRLIEELQKEDAD